MMPLMPPHMFMGTDGGYGLTPQTITPFVNRLTAVGLVLAFNYTFCAARTVAEHVYGILKGRFRFLQHKTDFEHQSTLRTALLCSVVLHNMIKVCGYEMTQHEAEECARVNQEEAAARSEYRADAEAAAGAVPAAVGMLAAGKRRRAELMVEMGLIQNAQMPQYTHD